MVLNHRTEDTKGYFQLVEGANVVATLSYSIAGENLIILDHTDVKPLFKGQNLGKKLVFEAVNYARAHQIKILSVCPFATSVFQKEASIRDVLR